MVVQNLYNKYNYTCIYSTVYTLYQTNTIVFAILKDCAHCAYYSSANDKYEMYSSSLL